MATTENPRTIARRRPTAKVTSTVTTIANSMLHNGKTPHCILPLMGLRPGLTNRSGAVWLTRHETGGNQLPFGTSRRNPRRANSQQCCWVARHNVAHRGPYHFEYRGRLRVTMFGLSGRCSLVCRRTQRYLRLLACRGRSKPFTPSSTLAIESTVIESIISTQIAVPRHVRIGPLLALRFIQKTIGRCFVISLERRLGSRD